MRCEVWLEKADSQRVWLANVGMASGFAQRAVGLLGRRHVARDEGIILPRCASVHTFGMRCAIDILFIDGERRVLASREALVPWRFAACRGARDVIELGAGGLALAGVVSGDQLSIMETT